MKDDCMTNINKIGWQFDHSYESLPDIFYTTPYPSPAEDPTIVCFNEMLAKELGLDANALQTEDGIQILAGNKLPEDGMHLAQAYAGHQFGNFTMLGDGRAILLGEHLTPEKERYDIQLKGAGRTMYSRGGDGLAALGPMLREYIISEAMHALNIPTSRSLAVIKSTDPVYREEVLSRGILTRVAKSHLRVGTFQYAAAYGEKSDIQAIADYAIRRHYPDHQEKGNPYVSLLKEVTEQQAALIAKWQLVGFIHGVMNTDNMTISGETIDYGPCAFMNTFDPNTVFSSIDIQDRYKYGNQPAIANWNLARFAETLLPLIDNDEETAIKHAEKVIKSFQTHFYHNWLDGMRAKLGLFDQKGTDSKLCSDLLNAMKKYQADYTDTFLALTYNQIDGMVLLKSEEFLQWHKQWKSRLSEQTKSDEEIKALMKKSNPSLIPRNHLVEQALSDAVEKEDYREMKQLITALSNPFAHTEAQTNYRKIPVPLEPYQTFCGT